MADQLEPGELAMMREVFRVFDKDQDKKISRTEFGNALKSLGITKTQDQLNALFDEADIDSSKFIEFKEFAELIVRDKLKLNTQAEIKLMFKAFDKNGDGSISPEELKFALKNLGQELTAEDIKELMIQVDKNRDGKIDINEFTNLIMDM